MTGKKYNQALLIALILAATLIYSAEFCPASPPEFKWSMFLDPPKEFRPFVRWWWPGNDVEEKELRREIVLLSDNYFGGAEIQAFDAGLDSKTSIEELVRRHSFDTESFYKNLAVVMEEAKAKGMTIDLTLGSGWPSGGSHIQPEQAVKTMFWGEEVVTGPAKKMEVKIPPPQKHALYKLSPILKYVAAEANLRWMPQYAKLVAVVAAKETGGNRSKNPLNLTSSIQLDPKSVQVLGLPSNGSKIQWDFPGGKWRIIAIYVCPDGQHISLSASPEPAFVADHFDAGVFKYNMEHLLGERTGLQKYYGAPFRAFFNDSFELKTDRFFAADFPAEFEKRRGYDITPLLPAVLIPGADNYLFIDGGLKAKSAFNFSGEDRRVQYDYQLTVSDLFIERFIANAEAWAEQRGLQSRVQAYGLNIDVIKAMGLSGIPATEQLYAGGYEVFLKMASSGAHLYNKPVVDAESMVWQGKDYMTTPLKIKVSADKLFTSGVNEVNYHGFPYAKDQKYGEAGWDPFSSPFAGAGGYSDNFAEKNSFWKYMAQINRYIARCQYVLRLGKPDADILIYYPWFGFPASFDQTSGDELLFNGEFDGEPKAGGNPLVAIGSKLFPMGPDDRAKWRASIRPLLKDLEDHGYTWDWVNDDSLEQANAEAGKISIRGNSWKALLIFNNQTMQPEAAANLARLAKNRAAILIIGAPPSEQPGYKNFAEGNAKVRAAMQDILVQTRAKNSNEAGALTALHEIGVDPGVKFEPQASPMRMIRRRINPSGQLIFFRNPEKSPAGFDLIVEGGCEDPFWLDPWNGAIYGGINNQTGAIKAGLPGYGSIILLCGQASDTSDRKSFPAWPRDRTASKEIEVKSWDLSVSGEDVEGGKFSANIEKLADWRDLKPLKYCSSPGTYQAEVDLPDFKPGQKAALSLAWVYGAAEVKINGKPAGQILVAPFEIDISNALQPGKNQIEITLFPALRNRFAGMAKKGTREYAQFKGREKDLIPEGIIGPVKILLF